MGTEQILEIGRTSLRHAWPEPHVFTITHLHTSQSWYRSTYLSKGEPPSNLVAPFLLPGHYTMWSVSSVSTFQGRKIQHPFSPRSTYDAKVNTRSALGPRSAQDAKVNLRSALCPPRTQKSTLVQPSVRSGRRSQHPFNPRSTQDTKVNTRSALCPLRTQKSTPVQPSIHPGRKSQHPFIPRCAQDAKFDTRSTLRSAVFQYLGVCFSYTNSY